MADISKVREQDAVFLRDGDVLIGSVRAVAPDRLGIYIEDHGDFVLFPSQVLAAHDGKVVLDTTALSPSVQEALQRVHDNEYTDL